MFFKRQLFHQGIPPVHRPLSCFNKFHYSQGHKKRTFISPDSHQTCRKDSTRQQLDHLLDGCSLGSSNRWILGSKLHRIFLNGRGYRDATALCMVQILEFPEFKVFSDNSTLIRAIFGNLRYKEIIGIVKDI
ncbi:hypothetical protein DY000_02035262 [Brassica cretica]|uniref:RNase III domain-containing protein n=1 Tax=Brassica cretica TaxID=69181 RepID=A0ABQ7DVN8_BRACR|nr:hypothetical protein DY000_02035262 [Brassica cretica]